MNHESKLAKAKAKLMLEHPYFGTIASSLELEVSEEIEAFSSDGDKLRYNDDYIEDAVIEDVEFALANGAMHYLLKHQHRVGERMPHIWQLSTDYTINSMLLKNGLDLPPRANYQERFANMYAEEIYEILRSEIIDSDREYDECEDQEQQNESQTPQENKSQKVNQSEEQRDVSFDEEFLEQLFKKMKRQGTLPKNLKYLIPEAFSHQIDWREALYRYIASYAKSSFSFMPPNMKYLYRGIYLPSLSSDLLRIVIALDTSGSVDEKLLQIFLAEVDSITQQYPNYEIDIITADAKIQSHEVFLPGESLNYELSGGGGTDFRVVFEYIDSYIDYPTILLYFTDGMGIFPDNEPSYDVLWIMPSEVEVPFGEVILIKTPTAKKAKNNI